MDFFQTPAWRTPVRRARSASQTASRATQDAYAGGVTHWMRHVKRTTARCAVRTASPIIPSAISSRRLARRTWTSMQNITDLAVRAKNKSWINKNRAIKVNKSFEHTTILVGTKKWLIFSKWTYDTHKTEPEMTYVVDWWLQIWNLMQQFLYCYKTAVEHQR